MIRHTSQALAFCALGALALFPNFFGAVEGRFFPVMGPLTLTDPTPVPPPEYRTKWHGTADKLRDCEYIRTEWYLGEYGIGGKVPVRVTYTDPPKVRGPGQLEWDGIVITLDPTLTLESSYSVAVHQCGIRPWQTRTIWFEGAAE